jgi:hypothetical protein
MTRRAIVLDANILIRAVLGQRVRELITERAVCATFARLLLTLPDALLHFSGMWAPLSR